METGGLKIESQLRGARKDLEREHRQRRAVKLSLCWGQMARGRDGSGGSGSLVCSWLSIRQGRARKGNGAGMALGSARVELPGRPVALPAAGELQGFAGGPSQRVPPGGLSAGTGEGEGRLGVRHRAHGYVGALLPSNLKNSTRECARVGQGGCRADRDGAQPLLLHTLAAAGSTKARSEHSNGEWHG